VRILEDGRDPGVSDVEVRDNATNGDTFRGCETPGAICRNNK
jgi:hypothetical protein